MNQNDLTQIKEAITMPCGLADTLLQNCTAAKTKRFPYTRYSRLAMALMAALTVMITGTTSYAAYNVYQEKNLTVFMDDTLSQAEIEQIGKELMQIPEITSCHFVSGDEAWEEFRTKYLDDIDGIADSFSENPLKDSFNYRLSVKLNADTQIIRDRISQIDGVRLVQNLTELKEERP